MSTLFGFSMSPLDKGESVGDYVTESVKIILDSGIEYRLGSLITTLEGDIEDEVRVFLDCFYKMAEDCNRITATIKIDYRAGREDGLTSKIKSVESKLGRDLNS